MEKMLMDPDSFVRRRAAVALFRMGGETVRQRIRAIAEEPEDLRPVWAAAGLISGDLTPSDVLAYPASADFLHELYPLEEANSAIQESPDPKRRLTAFRILQVLSPDAAVDAARVLEKDPDDNTRREAMTVLRNRGLI